MASRIAITPETERYVLVPESKVARPSPPPATAAAMVHDLVLHEPGSKAESKEEEKLTVPSKLMVRSLGVSGGARASLPPEMEATCFVRKRFRFRASAALSGASLTLNGFLGACGGICTVANTNLRAWASSFQIKRVVAWPPGGVSGSTNQVFIDWSSAGNSNFTPDTSRIVTIPDGVTVTKSLVFEPPTKSLAEFWYNPTNMSATGPIMAMTCPSGTIVDLILTFTLSNVNLGNNITIAAGSVGTVYYLALDGPSNNKLVPLGVPTTA